MPIAKPITASILFRLTLGAIMGMGGKFQMGRKNGEKKTDRQFFAASRVACHCEYVGVGFVLDLEPIFSP